MFKLATIPSHLAPLQERPFPLSLPPSAQTQPTWKGFFGTLKTAKRDRQYKVMSEQERDSNCGEVTPGSSAVEDGDIVPLSQAIKMLVDLREADLQATIIEPLLRRNGVPSGAR